MTDRFPLTPTAARLLTACDKVFGEVPRSEVVAFGLGVTAISENVVGLDSRAQAREAA